MARVGKRQAGFTLIEMLVVFALLALLLQIAAPRYLGTLETAKEKARQQNMATIRDALDKFKADQGRYPNELGELVDKKYLRQVPVDPVTNTTAWVPVAIAGGQEPGVHDVKAPSEAPAVTAPASTPASGTP
jgi:general secretion pathway protein G